MEVSGGNDTCPRIGKATDWPRITLDAVHEVRPPRRRGFVIAPSRHPATWSQEGGKAGRAPLNLHRHSRRGFSSNSR